MTMHKIFVRWLQLTTCLLLLISLWDCASIQKKEDILAIVDGEPVTRGDLEYSLQIAHRREALSSASALNISQYIQNSKPLYIGNIRICILIYEYVLCQEGHKRYHK